MDYFETGFTVRHPSWHGKEQHVLPDHVVGWESARSYAGLTWEPAKVPLFTQKDRFNVTAQDKVVAWVNGGEVAIVEVPDLFGIERDDSQRVLGAGVGKDFTPVTHKTMGEIFDALVEASDGQVKFETAGSVRGGRNVYGLAYLDAGTKVAGDDSLTYPFLAVTNAHDGTGALRVQYTNVRIVCWNTYNAAEMEGERSGRQYSFNHTGSVMERIEEAKLALKGLYVSNGEWIKLAEELAEINVDDVQVQNFVERFIDSPAEHGKQITPRVAGNIEKARALFKSTYMDSVTCAGHRGTALGLVDASVEYLDHLRTYKSTDSYLSRTVLRPEKGKAYAVKLARSLAG